MLEKYLRKNFGKLVELGEFNEDTQVERALKRHRSKRWLVQLAASLVIVASILDVGYLKFGGGKGKEVVQSAEEYYLLGVKAYEEGKYEKAAHYLEKVVNLGPEEEFRFDTYLKLADSLYNVTWPDREEPYRQALNYYNKALGRNVATPEQRAPHVAWIHYQMGNCQRNVRVFKKREHRKVDPPNPGDYSAVNYYDVVISEHPDSIYAPSAMYYKAASYRASEEFKKARETYHELYLRYPRHELAAEAAFEIADCFLEEANQIVLQGHSGMENPRTIEIK